MELSNYTKIFKALSNEQRLRIFIMLYTNCGMSKGSKLEAQFHIKGEPCCAAGDGLEKAFTKICDCMKLSRSTISHHFKELQNAGLITCEREGQIFRCRINKEVIDTVKNFLE
jgi:ArsR family transcriptional regulator